MAPSKKTIEEIKERMRLALIANPDITLKALSERFGLGYNAAWAIRKQLRMANTIPTPTREKRHHRSNGFPFKKQG
jgi:hypothetical protein